MSDNADLFIDDPAPHVRRIRLNRPEKRNALATPLLEALAVAVSAADDDPQIRCLIVTGGEEVFAAGADLKEMASKDARGGLDDPRPALWGRVRGCRKPIIAAVEGWCLGAGNEFLMCCDLAIAGAGAKFGQPETNLGIIPGAGGAATLPRLVGRSRAMRMVLLGEPIGAEEAVELGLIAEAVEKGQANARALELAEKIAGRAPLAMQQAKAVVRSAFEVGESQALSLERQAFSLLLGTDDKAEGVAAFFEKRAADWKGQ
ncbi:MAG: enoyl-CoA hydratase-related protein [Pseudomonadota bacterium]